MRFWGITGTNGKTTTTWIFAEFVNACPGRRCGYVTTVEANTTARRFYTGYTTPPLGQLKEIFAEMEANGCTDCVMEVSSHAIHQHRTGDTVFSGGAFTNLTEDHLDYHKTMEAYFDVKLDFARRIAAANVDGKAPYVVCLDGGNGREMYEAVRKLPLDVVAASNGTDGTNGAPFPRYDLSELKLAGAYNRSNVLTAAALAEKAGVPHEVIQKVIPTLKPRWGRLELVENPRVKAKVFVDFAHTPDGLEKVLAAVHGEMIENARRETRDETSNLKPQTSNLKPRLWVVFGAGGDRDPMKRPLMGEACARLADMLVVTSDNPRSEDPLKIINAIVSGIKEGQRSREDSNNSAVQPSTSNFQPPTLNLQPSLRIEPDRRKAIAYALENAAEGDVVVIAGKGHETTQEIAGVKHPFDDRAVVRAFGRVTALYPHGFCAGVTAALAKARAAVASGEKLYCLHEIVHNEQVVASLATDGVVFVEDLESVPEGAAVMFSAHGVSPAVRKIAAERGLRVVDATCPFVERVHRAARDFAERGLRVAVVGKADHAEVKGIVGEVEEAGGEAVVVDSGAAARPGCGEAIGVVSQTTMNSDEVKAVVDGLSRQFRVETLAEVCKATKERQDAVRAFGGDALVVLGSANSSNTRRLCEVARCPSFRAGTLAEVEALDLSRFGAVGVTSGASTPEDFFMAALDAVERKVGR